ncbi:MAG TPA: hypothetical protein VGJ05_05045 [Fimbriiglobus sp.]
MKTFSASKFFLATAVWVGLAGGAWGQGRSGPKGGGASHAGRQSGGATHNSGATSIRGSAGNNNASQSGPPPGKPISASQAGTPTFPPLGTITALNPLSPAASGLFSTVVGLYDNTSYTSSRFRDLSALLALLIQLEQLNLSPAQAVELQLLQNDIIGRLRFLLVG